MSDGNAAEQDDAVTEQRVTPLELFFDLVFVFALTQVTALMAAEPTWIGLLRGMAVLTVLWWAWVAYVWIGTTTKADDGPARFTLLAAMGAMFVTALAAPQAFGADGLLFGVAYFVVRFVHVVMFRVVGRSDPGVGRAVARLAPGLLLGASLIVVAGFLEPGWPRAVLWVLAVAIDLASPLVTGTEGWRVSPGHFAERHGLVVIVAFGESLVALGVGVSAVDLDGRTVTAVVLGFAVVACLWWLYFDVTAIAAEHRVASAEPREQVGLARDAYNYMHLPMVAGIVLLALGLKKVFGDLDTPLKLTISFALLGGVALYLLGLNLFRLRLIRTISRPRLVVTVVAVVLIPVATLVPAWASLAAVVVLCVGLVAFERLRYAEGRSAIRDHTH
jgi:low temperature requirement protein LtrA